jgi:hypothetical protein
MSQTIFTAGNATDGIGASRGDDGSLVIKTGAAGSQVNALTLAADGTPTFLKPAASSTLTSGTAIATTSGTSHDFTGIPSWVKRITVMFNGVSTNGSSHWLVQAGAGSIQTTGYESGSAIATSVVASTAGMVLLTGSAAFFWHGHFTFTLIGSNRWICSHSIGRYSDGGSNVGGGGVTLSGALDRIRLTTVNGTDTFDAGSINILYE